MLRPLGLLLAAAIAAAACSGGTTGTDGDGATPTDTSSAPTSEPTETSTTPTTSEPVAVPQGVAPLTGETLATPVARPALVVKIDNHDRARPQFGLGDADLVFEEIVEGGITRFAAVFHSADADVLGPIRSVRTSDFDLLSALGTPLFAHSGGNQRVLAGLRDVDVVDVSAGQNPDVYRRDDSRRAPHNLVSSSGELWALGTGPGPEPWFSHRAPLEPFRGEAVTGVEIAFGANVVAYSWDGELEGWRRTQNGTDHLDASGQVVAPPNVIVQFVVYGRSEADERSPEVEHLGRGDAWVFSDGRLVEGGWERVDASTPTVFTDVDGEVIELGVGATWIALVRLGQATLVGG